MTWESGDSRRHPSDGNQRIREKQGRHHHDQREHRLGAGGAPFDDMHWRQLPPKN